MLFAIPKKTLSLPFFFLLLPLIDVIEQRRLNWRNKERITKRNARILAHIAVAIRVKMISALLSLNYPRLADYPRCSALTKVLVVEFPGANIVTKSLLRLYKCFIGKRR